MTRSFSKTGHILLVGTALLPPGMPGAAAAQSRTAAETPAPTAKPEPTSAPTPTATDDAAPTSDAAATPPRIAPGDAAGQAAPDPAPEAQAPDRPQSVTVPAPVVTDREQADTAADGSILVTGSRIGGYDPTTDVKVYTQDDIKALGVSNVQDFIRTLPQNQASVGYGINNRSKTEVKFDAGGLGGLGIAGVNLRGLGTKNTLVLVNGRRIAGAAGIEEGFANINTIPLAAVERVEVSLGGGSAVYGADAMAGVVNFILKKHYNGYDATVRHENSSTGAHTSQATHLAATSWGSGSVTATLSLTRIDPAQNARLGYVTHDYRRYIAQEQLAALGQARFSLDQRRSLDGAQPAAIILNYPIRGRNGQPGTSVYDVYQWRPGGDVTHPTFAGLQPIDRETLAPNIPVDAGEHQRSGGLSLNVEQRITDRLHVTLDYLGAINTLNLRELWQTIDVTIPYGQAYNPVKRSDLPADAIAERGVEIVYFPKAEYEDGRMRRGFQESTIRSHTVTGGLRYDIDHDTALYANYGFSRNTATGTQRGIQNLTRTVDGKCVANTGGITAPDLAEIVAAQCAALNSSDPKLAFNFLDDGSGRSGAPASVFFATTHRLANTAGQQNADILLTAAPVTLPAGKLRLAIGGETRSNSVSSAYLKEHTAQRLNTHLWAGYAELRVPVIAETMGVPLLRTFDLSLKGRYDRYDSHGPIGTVGNIPFADGGSLIRGKSTFDRFSPDASVAWTPFPGLLLKGGWSSNFTPPPFTALYDIGAGQLGEQWLWQDPFAPDSDAYYLWDHAVPVEKRANPLLKPAVSRNYHLGATLTPPKALHNLNVQVDYYRTRIRNRTGYSDELVNLLSPRDYYGLSEFFPRDDGGRIVRKVLKPINIGWDLSESIDVQISYAVPTHIGLITPSIFYTRNLQQVTSYVGRQTQISTLGTSNGLDKYRIIGNLDFSRRDVMARLTVRYIPPYENTYALTIDQGDYQDSDGDEVHDKPMPIRSLTTYDFTARWQAARSLTLSAGGRNILNAKPPFALIDRRPFDASRYDLRGRVLYAEARVNF